MNMKRQQEGGLENHDDPEARGCACPTGAEPGGVSGGADRPGSSLPSSSSEEVSPGSGRSPGLLAQRLRGILRDDADLALEERSHLEGGIMRWLQALDLQVIGACRADERLKPLLKFNFSCGAAEDHLLAQLSQHFEVPEVGMLIRCLCVPLVSMRVGKVNKRGNMLFPTDTRGYLNLILSPSSDMRILFCGDDGCTERLAVVACNDEESEVSVEEILADGSCRSFLLRLPEGNVSYFWCSEKSKENGEELLQKMHSLFQIRPSLANLTGISEVRLESFATHVRTYLRGSARSSEIPLDVSSTATHVMTSSSGCHSATLNVKSTRSHHNSCQAGKCHPTYQGCLSPKPIMFKDTNFRSLSLRNGTRDKLNRRVDSPRMLATSAAASAADSCENSLYCHIDDADDSENNSCNPPIGSPELPSCPSLTSPSSLTPLTFQLPFPQVVAPSSSLISPYYCWCPPCTSAIQSVGKPELCPCLGSETIPLPPLSSLLSSASSVQLQPSNQSLDCSELPVLDFPSLFPVNPYVSLPSSQQIPTFTPFMADPIVHVPVMDICSSGPGYLVSAGPAISSAIPPLLPSLTPEPASMVEKNARETLRMLIASSPSSQSMTKVLPASLTTADESFPYADGHKPCLLVTGSRSLYTGAQDVDAVVGGVGWLGITPLSFERASFVEESLIKKEKDTNPSFESQKDVVDDQIKNHET